MKKLVLLMILVCLVFVGCPDNDRDYYYTPTVDVYLNVVIDNQLTEPVTNPYNYQNDKKFCQIDSLYYRIEGLYFKFKYAGYESDYLNFPSYTNSQTVINKVIKTTSSNIENPKYELFFYNQLGSGNSPSGDITPPYYFSLIENFNYYDLIHNYIEKDDKLIINISLRKNKNNNGTGGNGTIPR